MCTTGGKIALILAILEALSAFSFQHPFSSRSVRSQRIQPCLRACTLDVEFLGHGKDAIVRPGAILLAPPEESHHFLNDAAIFVYSMGEDSSGRYVIRSVILDQPTPFTIGEMASDDLQSSQLSEKLLFRGGEFGGDSAFMLHSDRRLADLCGIEMIGSSGIFQGGLGYATSNNYSIKPEEAKFFFNYMEFTETELEGMLDSGDDPVTAWLSVSAPPEFVLDSTCGKGEVWKRLRNILTQRGDLV